MKNLTRGGWLVVAALAATTLARAQSTANVGATFMVASQTKLTLSISTLSFPNADPDTVPSIPAAEGAIMITAEARATAGNQVILTVLASDDFRSGMNTIPVSKLTWTTAGPGFIGGTMSRSLAQRVATFGDSGTNSGTQAYSLANSWTYPTGSYSTTVTYTLTTP
jgi:hypothetical protein